MSPSDSTSSPKVESKTKIHNTDENSDDESKQPKLSNDELLYDPEMDGKVGLNHRFILPNVIKCMCVHILG